MATFVLVVMLRRLAVTHAHLTFIVKKVSPLNAQLVPLSRSKVQLALMSALTVLLARSALITQSVCLIAQKGTIAMLVDISTLTL
jgi:hypothetical protein